MATYSDMVFENLSYFNLPADGDTFINCTFKNVIFTDNITINVTNCAFYNVTKMPTLVTDSSPLHLEGIQTNISMVINGSVVINDCGIYGTVECIGSSTINRSVINIIKLNGGVANNSRFDVMYATYGESYGYYTATKTSIQNMYINGACRLTLNHCRVELSYVSGALSEFYTGESTTLGGILYNSLTSITNCSFFNTTYYPSINPFFQSVPIVSSSIKYVSGSLNSAGPFRGSFPGSSIVETLSGGVKKLGNPTGLPLLPKAVTNCDFLSCNGIAAINKDQYNTLLGTLFSNCNCSFSKFIPGSQVTIKDGGYYASVDFSSSSGVSLVGSTAGGSTGNFINVNFIDTNFAGTNLSNQTFNGCDLRGANFTGCDLSGTTFVNCLLTGAGSTSFEGVNTSTVIYQGCDGIVDTSSISRYENRLPSSVYPNVYGWSNTGTPLSVTTSYPVAVTLSAGITSFSLSLSRDVNLCDYKTMFSGDKYYSKMASYNGTSFSIETPTDCVMYLELNSGSVTISKTGFIASPNTLAMTNIIDGTATLTWSPVSGASSYKLYRNPGDTASKQTTLVGTVTSPYTDVGLTNGTKYTYTATAIGAVGESIESTLVSGTPSSPITVDANTLMAWNMMYATPGSVSSVSDSSGNARPFSLYNQTSTTNEATVGGTLSTAIVTQYQGITLPFGKYGLFDYMALASVLDPTNPVLGFEIRFKLNSYRDTGASMATIIGAYDGVQHRGLEVFINSSNQLAARFGYSIQSTTWTPGISLSLGVWYTLKLSTTQISGTYTLVNFQIRGGTTYGNQFYLYDNGYQLINYNSVTPVVGRSYIPTTNSVASMEVSHVAVSRVARNTF